MKPRDDRGTEPRAKREPVQRLACERQFATMVLKSPETFADRASHI